VANFKGVQPSLRCSVMHYLAAAALRRSNNTQARFMITHAQAAHHSNYQSCMRTSAPHPTSHRAMCKRPLEAA